MMKTRENCVLIRLMHPGTKNGEEEKKYQSVSDLFEI